MRVSPATVLDEAPLDEPTSRTAEKPDETPPDARPDTSRGRRFVLALACVLAFGVGFAGVWIVKGIGHDDAGAKSRTKPTEPATTSAELPQSPTTAPVVGSGSEPAPTAQPPARQAGSKPATRPAPPPTPVPRAEPAQAPAPAPSTSAPPTTPATTTPSTTTP